jgi:hypothetical protein
VLDEVADQSCVSTKLSRVGRRLEDDDRPVVADEQRGASKDMRGAATTMNAGRDNLGARWEVRGRITWVVCHGGGWVVGGAAAGGRGWWRRSKIARGLRGFVR